MSVNQEGSDPVAPRVANKNDTSKGISTEKTKRRKGATAEYMKYHKPTAKRRALKDQQDTRVRPSDLILEVIRGGGGLRANACGTPRIVEFINMEDNAAAVASTVRLDEPLFQPYPSKVVFERYEAFGEQQKVLSFRNNDTVNRQLKVLPLDSPHFAVSGPRNPHKMRALKQTRVAPGMEVCYVVTFRPQEVRAYSAELFVVTEREKFMVFLSAVGHRAVLDFPDKVVMPHTAVKGTGTKNLVVRNLGKRVASVSLSCQPAGTFSIQPTQIVVAVGSSAQLVLAFKPERSIRYEGELIVEYDSGEVTHVALSASAGGVNVYLSTPSLQLEPAYIGLCSQKTLKIVNRSEIPVKFAWETFATSHEEEEERSRLHAEMAKMQSLEEEILLKGTLAVKQAVEGRGAFDAAGMQEDGSRFGGEEDEPQIDGDELDSYDDQEEWAAITDSSVLAAGGGAKSPRPSLDSKAVSTSTTSSSSSALAKLQPSHQAAQAALKRKYRHLRRSLGKDRMLFADEIFEIRPLEGDIWARSEIEVTVFFRPRTTTEYGSYAFLDCVGREERLPLFLGGGGIGPKVALSYDVLDMGDIFVGSKHRYEVILLNRGDIAADWVLQAPQTPLASKFRFCSLQGTLDVKDSVTLAMEFESDILGEFSELFRFILRGNEEPLTCQFKGHVIGPTFHFDVDEVDFGEVSYDCPVNTTIGLFNTSEISMSWRARVPQDGTFRRKEITITPSNGTLLPGQSVGLVVELMSQTVKDYEYYITVDVDKVGEELLSIPLKANCQVPVVELKSKDLSYGECFLRFHEMRTLVLVNASPSLTGFFRVLPQDVSTHAIARVASEPQEGQVPPGGRTEVKLWLTCEKLGGFRLPVVVEIKGSVEPPLQVTTKAIGIGPTIKPDLEAIEWGPTPCLADVPRGLRLSNPGKIPAPFKIFLRSSSSKFRVDVREGVLAPSEEAAVTITANVDDSIVHKDELHVIVPEGKNRLVLLSAKGTGTTVRCAEEISSVDFGPVFTNSTCIRRITLENRGRRQQALKWVNNTVREKQMLAAAKLKAKQKRDAQEANGGGGGGRGTGRGGSGADGRSKLLPDPIEATFTVNPPEIELRPRTAITFTFRGFSSTVGRLSESMVCEARVGKEKRTRQIFKTETTAEFVAPLLDFSQPEFHFSHVWDPDVPMNPSSKSLRMTNSGQLPLEFMIKTQSPFSVGVAEHSLEAGESRELSVGFDPGYRGDSQSRRYESKLSVTYREHPQRDALPVVGDVAFPNLDFEYTKVSFGCVLNDTTMTKAVRVTNNSMVDCAFSWSFLEDVHSNKGRHGANPRRVRIPVNQIFDILPIRSFLRPRESEEIEFVYYGHANRKALGKCACDVVGGPTYTVDLVGEASNMGFRLDRAHLDFGRILYSGCEERELYITNTGKVAFPFRVILDQLTRPKVLEVHPATGVVHAGEDKMNGPNRVRILVRFRPGLPEKMREVLVIEAGHFDPVQVSVYGEGVYVAVAISLPRDTSVTPWGEAVTEEPGQVTWNTLLGNARRGLANFDPSLAPPDEENLPSPPKASTNIGNPGSGGGGGGKTRRSDTASRAMLTPGVGGNADNPSASASTQPSAGGRAVATESMDGHSSTASASGGRRARTAGSGASYGKTEVRAGLSCFDADMEANRRAYIRHLQTQAEMVERSLAVEAVNEAHNNALEGTPCPDDGGSSIEIGVDDTERQGGAIITTAGPSSQSTKIGAIDSRGGGGVSSNISNSSSREAGTGRRAAKSNKPAGPVTDDPTDLASYVIARHVADFGNVVKGFTKTKAFRVMNTSKLGPVSWSFPQNSLASTGYSIEPEKVMRLPEGASAVFTASFQARKGFPLGIRSLELPIKVKNGPQTVVLLRANVTSPEVELSQKEIHFGSVLVGRSKTSCIQVHNVSPVVAEWDFKRLFGDSRDEARFKIMPRGGSLHRDQRVNVQVEFMPTDDRVYSLKMAVKVASTAKNASVVLQGRGVQPRLRFDPPFLKLGPVLPHMPEGDSRAVDVINESAWDVEIFSLNFDQVHLEEEKILTQAPGFSADEILRMPPRLPGEALHQSLLDFARAREETRKRAERREAKVRARENHGAIAAAIAPTDPSRKSIARGKPAIRGSTTSENPAGRGSIAPASPGRASNGIKIKATTVVDNNAEGGKVDGVSSEDDEEGNSDDGACSPLDGGVFAGAANESWLEPLPSSPASMASGDRERGWSRGKNSTAAVVPEWDRVPTVRERGRACDVVVTGPSLSGKSTLSHALAGRYGVPALSLDEAVKEAMRLRSRLGAKVRAAVHWFTAMEEARWARGVEAARERVAAVTAEQIPPPKPTKGKKKGAAAAAAAAAASAAEAAAARRTEAELALQALLKPQGLSSRLLAEVLRWRLAKPDFDRGVVLDGLDSRFAAANLEIGVVDPKDGEVVGRTEAVAARAAAAAMPEARLLVLRFRGEKHGYAARLERLQREATSIVNRLEGEFAERTSSGEFDFVDPTPFMVSENVATAIPGTGDRPISAGAVIGGSAAAEAAEEDSISIAAAEDETVRGAADGGVKSRQQFRAREGSGVDNAGSAGEDAGTRESGIVADSGHAGVPKPQPMNLDDPDWDVHGDHMALPVRKELSETELWALDERQREEHFRTGVRCRRAKYDRAKRALVRVANVPAGSGETPTPEADPTTSPREVLTATGASVKAEMEAPSGAMDDNSNAAAEAMATIADPYAEYVQTMEAFVLPIFAALVTTPATGGELDPATTSGMTSERPGSEVDVTSNAKAVSGGEAGHGASAAIVPGSLVAASLISEVGGTSAAMSPGPETRVFHLEMGDDSLAEGDLEAAHAMLPLPTVPAPDPKLLPIPPDKLRQLFRRPPPQVQKPPPIELLEILPWFDSSEASFLPPEPNSTLSGRADASAEGEWGSKNKDTVNVDGDRGNSKGSEKGNNLEQIGGIVQGRAVSGAVNGNPYRWVIRAGESIRFAVKFSSSRAGTFDPILTFETVGTGRRHSLHVSGTCAFPSINCDPRNVFMRRVNKDRPEGAVPPVSKRYVVSRGEYEFGPLLTWKRAEDRIAPMSTSEGPADAAAGGGGERLLAKLRAKEETISAVRKTNSEIFRLSNDARFPVKISMAFDQQSRAAVSGEDPSAASGKTPAPKAGGRGSVAKPRRSPATVIGDRKAGATGEGDGGKSSNASHRKKTFYVEPEALELTVGETKEIRVWAFPTEVKVYKDTLIVCLADNPRPVLFPVSCSGASPRMVLEGPWEEALAKERAALEELGRLEDLPEDAPPKERKELEALRSAAEARVRQAEDNGPIIEFDRLLLGRVESRNFVVRNACQVPCRWKVCASHPTFTKHPDAFRVIPGAKEEGVVEVGGSARVSVMFSAVKEGVFEPSLTVEYTDNEIGFGAEGQGGNKVVKEEVKILAEAYRIRAVAFETPEEAVAAEAERATAKGAAKGEAPPSSAEVAEDREEDQQPRPNDGCLDFGRLRVGDSVAQRFTLRNRGKYTIAFAFRVRRGLAASLFTVEPSKGAIESGKAAEMCVTFCSREEVHLKDNRDIRCVITEPHTGEAVEEFSVVASAVSTWSRFRLQPRRGINFGPVAYNAETMVKIFELKNEGEFEFVFAIQGKGLASEPHEAAIRRATPKALLSPEEKKKAIEEMETLAVPEKGAKGKGKASNKESKEIEKPASKIPNEALFLGRFEVSTSGGLIQPGQTVSVAVRYSPEEANAHRETITLKVSGSDPSDTICDLAASYDLLAESCIPGIVTSGWREIFEEQPVISSIADALDGEGRMSRSVGGVGGEGGAGAGAGGGGGRAGGRACFAEEQRIFMYGSVVSSQAPVGVCERFKITNENKIPCTVKFSVCPACETRDNEPRPLTESAKGKKRKETGGKAPVGASEAEVTAFTVHPETSEIPPHEHRYVSAYFRPTEMRSYRCRFEAKVFDNDDASTGRMEFLMSGNGTMPTVTLESPLDRDQSGAVIMNFGEVCARKSRRIPLVLRNDGILPVSCLFEMEFPEAQDGDLGANPTAASAIKKRDRQRKGDFLFAAAGGSVTLQPKEKKAMDVVFQPRCKPKEGELVSLTQRLRMTVLHNPFDAAAFLLSGTCLSHDVVFEDLPGATDELVFEQVDILHSVVPDGENAPPGAPGSEEVPTEEESSRGGKDVTFSLLNQAAFPCRFVFSRHKHFRFSPSVGHLPPGSRREVKATFNPKEPVTYSCEPVELVTQKIRYIESNEELNQHGACPRVDVEWDDSKTQLSEATEDDMRVLLQEEGVFSSAGSTVSVPQKRNKNKKRSNDTPPPEGPPVRTLWRGPISKEGGVQMVYTVQPEPRFKPLDGTTASRRPLRCSGVADRARYELGEGITDGSRTVAFRNTAMFQCRVHKFTVRNPGTTRLPYKWTLSDLRCLEALEGSSRLPSQLRTSRSLIAAGFEDAVGGGEGAGFNTVGKLNVPCPFSVEPCSGDIEVGGEQTFAVRFAPQEVHDFFYALVAKMPTLPKGQEPLKITLRGRSLRPVCHFAFQESPDYFQRRQNHLLANELGQQGLAIEAASVRVLEVVSRGTLVRNTRRFYVVNPTNVGYNFSWESQGNPHPAWRCVTQRGMILAGKRGEMVFEFTPDDMNTAEAFFRFRIREHGVSEMFLFAGSVVEPDVTVDRARVDYGALMLEASLKETFHIVNREPMPHSFVFDKNSLGMAQNNDDPRKRAVLEVRPTSALLPAKGRVPIEVTFCPREEKFHNFNLIFSVRKKQTKLSINVKGEGFKVHAKLLLLQGEAGGDKEGTEIDAASGAGEGKSAVVAAELFAFPQINMVDFGSVHINERATRKITIINPGKFSVDYLWQWRAPPGPALNLSGAKRAGSVKKGDRVELGLDFLPAAEVILDGADLVCTVAGRYDYVLRIVGRGIRPGLQFSFQKHDFGPCFITPAGSIPNPERVTLKVTNRDPSAALSLDCLHQADRCFWVTCEPSVLEAGQSMDVPLHFVPRDGKHYAFGVPFLVNGSYTVKLVVVGEGCPARLELANLAHKHLTFGMMPEGHQATKQVKVVNRSKRAIEFELVDAQDLGIGKLESKGVRFTPALPTTLAPRESTMIEVFFIPETRLPSFTETLFVRAGATSELGALLTISGQSTGMEICLGVDTLSFGTVCAGSQRTQRLGLENRGDLPARFRWNEETFGEHFTVSPLEGMLTPLTEATMEVVFTPEFVDDDIRQESVLCMVEGYSPLPLTLTGSCVPQPADTIHTLSFKSRAREASAQSVTLENPTDKNWFISPVLKGEHWQEAGQLQVPAKGKANYAIEFFPLVMTSSSPPPEEGPEAQSKVSTAGNSSGGQKSSSERKSFHDPEDEETPADGKPAKLTGSLFFALPDGGAVLYLLEGVADGPEAASVMELETPAKTVLAFTVPVCNWLRRAQRFTMKAVLEEGTPSSTKLSGAKTIEVPAMATKDFALRFLAYREGVTGVTGATVTFTNEATREYLFHEIRVKTMPPGIWETIELEGSVRKLTRRLITVANPLRPDEPITFPKTVPKDDGGTPAAGSHGEGWWRCSSPHVRLARVGEMAGNLEGVFAVDYRPLVATEDGKPEEADLSFDIEELGTYRYALRLSAKPPASSSSLCFVSALGATQSEAFSMRVFNSDSPVDFECRVGGEHGTHFGVPTKVIAPPCPSWDGQDVRVEVVFEPERTGDVEDTLVLTSKEHGTYTCKLTGMCSPPLPQGPFKITPGGQREILFRNVFASAVDFTFICDHPAFAIMSGSTKSVSAKSIQSVIIKFSPEAADGSSMGSTSDPNRSSMSGKLIVQRVDGLAGTPPWIFYLHGVIPLPS